MLYTPLIYFIVSELCFSPSNRNRKAENALTKIIAASDAVNLVKICIEFCSRRDSTKMFLLKNAWKLNPKLTFILNDSEDEQRELVLLVQKANTEVIYRDALNIPT